MKSIGLSAAILFFAALFTAQTMAQTASPTGTSKIAIVDSSRFDDPKTGISRYVQAFKSLETEFKPSQDEIRGIEARLKTISEQYKTLQSAKVADPKSIEAKREEGEKLQLEYNYKQEQYKVALDRRLSVVVSPVQMDIGKALADYSKQKGFQVLFDIGKDEKGMLIWADMAAVDATADFIKFYNARPATSTTK